MTLQWFREEEVPDPAAPAEGEYAEYTEEQQYAVSQSFLKIFLQKCISHTLNCTLSEIKITVCLQCNGNLNRFYRLFIDQIQG